MSVLGPLLRARRERPVFVASAIALLAVLLTYPLVDAWLRAQGIAAPVRPIDLGAYYGAVKRWMVGDPLYVRTDAGGFHGSYLYPPVALLLFRPLVMLPFRTIHLVWGAAGLFVLWVGVQAAATALGADLHPLERLGLLPLCLGFAPVLLGLKMGQTAPLLAGLLALSLWALLRGAQLDGRRGWAARLASGGLTAVVCVIKPAYAPVAAHLLADRDRLLGGALTLVVATALSLLVFGVETHRTYLDVLAWGLGGGGIVPPPIRWVPPYFRPLYPVRGQALVLRLAGSALVAGTAVALGRADRGRGGLASADGDAYGRLAPAGADDRLAFALGVVAMPLLTPIAYAYYLAAVLPAAFVLLADELARGGAGHPLVVVGALACLQIHSQVMRLIIRGLPEIGTAVTALLQPGLWGVAALVGLAALRAGQRLDATRPWKGLAATG
ncbi:MAG: glycosyltransferase family 87 protein [Haloferacaceae archaeon]